MNDSRIKHMFLVTDMGFTFFIGLICWVLGIILGASMTYSQLKEEHAQIVVDFYDRGPEFIVERIQKKQESK